MKDELINLINALQNSLQAAIQKKRDDEAKNNAWNDDEDDFKNKHHQISIKYIRKLSGDIYKIMQKFLEENGYLGAPDISLLLYASIVMYVNSIDTNDMPPHALINYKLNIFKALGKNFTKADESLLAALSF